jgi:hypothetical protein
VMEYVDGPTLRSRIADGPVAPVDAARMAKDLGEALHVVHLAGVVHRDIKPANVLLRRSLTPGEEFTATLADFGIAHLVGSSRLTTPGTLLGTAAYLSPEQVRGAEPAPASDIYALGLVLLESLTGERVFAQPVVHEAALARLTQDPDIPGSLGYGWKSLLTAMTAREPGDRPSALDVVAASRGLRADAAAAAGAPGAAGAGAAAVAIAAASTAAMTVAAPTVTAPTVTAPDETLAATRVMTASDAPTVAFGAQHTGSNAAPSRRSAPPSPPAPHGPSSTPDRSRRRGLVLVGLGAGAVLAAVLAWTLLMPPETSAPPATNPASTEVPAGPESDPSTVDEPSGVDDPAGVDEPSGVDPAPAPAPEPVTTEPVAPTTPVDPEPSETTEPVVPPEPANPGNGNGNSGPGNGNGNGKGNGKSK